MKKKILISVLILSALGFGVYSYLYKEHRDISTEEAIKGVSVDTIFNQYKRNELKANANYLNQVIEVNGTVTNINATEKVLTVDGKLFASFQDIDLKDIKSGSTVNLKGRFLGYDELLEELKMDNCFIIK